MRHCATCGDVTVWINPHLDANGGSQLIGYPAGAKCMRCGNRLDNRASMSWREWDALPKATDCE